MPRGATRTRRRVREDDGRVGVRPDTVLAVASGVEGLAATLLERAVRANDREWLMTPAARFWANVGGISAREYERTLTRWLG